MREDPQTNPSHIFNWADEDVIKSNGLQNLQKLYIIKKSAVKIESSEENEVINVSNDQSIDDSNDSTMAGEEGQIVQFIEC